MTSPSLPDDLVLRDVGGRIVLVVLDGLGGLPHPDSGRTELESARTPNLDRLAGESSLGSIVPVAPGITPGSGPAHLALFGYDPLHYLVGRGALSALGVGFDLRPGDLAVRLNLATLDGEGRVTDRRAGRPSDEEARAVVARLAREVEGPQGAELFLLPEKEHRVVLVLRGEGLDERIRDTDPQAEGVPPHPPDPLAPEAARTSALVGQVLDRIRELLSEEERISGVLARGFARYEGFPSMEERFGLRGAAVARYPMYRGVARLVGMEIPGVPGSDDEAVAMAERAYEGHDFLFLHYKTPDARGEDGDFEGKAASIEAADAWIERIAALDPDVLVVTGDHATPSALRAHSWHAVPLLLRSRWARPTAAEFGETACRSGDLGRLESKSVMTLALAHAGRLAKFGA
jgi:2,3-bisphosphoglycerate-independent phosphoglycerate mutase